MAEGARSADEAMARYAQGETAAFEQLYDVLAPRLQGYLLRHVRNQARAEDLLQQTFLHMHRARGRFIPGAPVMPWAFAIARRLVIDGVRHDKHEVVADLEANGVDLVSPDAAADDVLQAKEAARRIEKEIANLPETQRVAFELLKRDGLSVREAAQVLGTTVNTVKLRAHRAYVALRAVLGETIADRGVD
jgi:RNA polymerase sigma-70 factor (ECF subfamily)